MIKKQSCIICNKEKILDDFYKNSQNITNGGFDGRCKECHKEYARNKLKENYTPEKGRKKYNKRKTLRKHIENFNRMKEKYPEKYKARYTLRNAVRLGMIEKKPCVVCGDKKTEGHHGNYGKPLDVIWLCKNHHIKTLKQ